jgi:hypothetical protein
VAIPPGDRRDHGAGGICRLTIGDQDLHSLAREILLEDGGESAHKHKRPRRSAKNGEG